MTTIAANHGRGAGRTPTRLRSSRRVGEVFSQGRRSVHGTVAVHALETAEGHVRATAVASRRIGTAVVRNRAKRLLREAARTVAWRDGLDLVLVARRSIVGVGCATVAADLAAAAAAGDLDDGGPTSSTEDVA